jgi:GAF domain-containing protein
MLKQRSELVLPILKSGILVAVLDIDSLSLNRFNEDDLSKLQACATVIEQALHHNK